MGILNNQFDRVDRHGFVNTFYRPRLPFLDVF
jgi:hypothetical protein